MKRCRFIIIVLTLCILLAGCSSSKEPADLSDPKPDHYDVDLDDLVLYDKNDILILAKGYCDDGERGGKLYMKIFNNGETDIDVTADRGFTVNDCTIGFIGNLNNCYTPAGTSRYYALSFEDAYLEPVGIDQIHKLNVVLKLGIIEDHTGTGILDHSDPVEIILREGEDYAPDGETVIDEKGIRIIFVDLEEGSNYYRAKFYVENNSDTDISIRRFLRVEDEEDVLITDYAFSRGQKGAMNVTLDEWETDLELNEIDYLDISLSVHDGATDQILTYRDNYIVELD